MGVVISPIFSETMKNRQAFNRLAGFCLEKGVQIEKNNRLG
jgi:hypothetical protein